MIINQVMKKTDLILNIQLKLLMIYKNVYNLEKYESLFMYKKLICYN